jgi:murein DD-endopeptidase MepM/ murein hydrolase activator NlpD
MAMKHAGQRKPKTRLGKWWSGMFGRLFCKRSIIIISEHKTQHVPFAIGMQLMAMIGVMVVVGWASYSSGSYMAAQSVLQQKDQKIAETSEQNAKVEAEFSLLKRDLMKMAEEEKNGRNGNKIGEYAKMVTEQYKQDDNKVGQEMAEGLGEEDPADKYNAVFARIDYLENKVKDLQTTHDQMMADIRSTTGGKIAELEKVIAATGMDANQLQQKAEAKRKQDEAHREKYGRIENGQGGEYEPIKTSVLQEKETELYFNLKKMMTLNDIVSVMPLAFPLASSEYHQTSGFGTRIDPFRGRLAFHSGVDLAGPIGTRIKATSDGKVVATGWMNAYGNAVDIDHGLGFVTRYGHLSKILVQEGQAVKKGDVIAVQGSTGRSTGNHLHYEVRYNDAPINPSNFLKAGTYVR